MPNTPEKILTVENREAIEMMWRMGVSLEYQLPWTRGAWNTLIPYMQGLPLADKESWLDLKVRLKK